MSCWQRVPPASAVMALPSINNRAGDGEPGLVGRRNDEHEGDGYAYSPT